MGKRKAGVLFMTYFHSYRTTPFEPSFTWVPTAREAADRINSFHEDYPKRVPMTERMLELPFEIAGTPRLQGAQEIHTIALAAVHWFIFQDLPHAGNFREVNVKVGLHHPPDWQIVPTLMVELQEHYLGKINSIDDLVDWYSDFETIHPFQDGNGRVGGVVVASFAHARHPEQGWLAANQ